MGASYLPVIIIGAPRSGTNMLRDVLCELDGVGTWPCDEINYIWRHGNISAETDQFERELATPAVKRYIRRQFDALAKKQRLNVVVEKTCANSLRVPFVNEVIPDARYIFIVRNGYDALASANLRWKAKLDIGYLLKKARYVPLLDLPFYAIRYVMNRIYRLFSGGQRLAFWGPKWGGMDDLLRNNSLETVCAVQWKQCVELAERGLENIDSKKVVALKYEDFVRDPEGELKRILDSFELTVPQEQISRATSGVRVSSVGKGKQQMEQPVVSSLEPLIGETLTRHGYE